MGSIRRTGSIAEAGPCDLLLVVGGDHFRRDAAEPLLRRSLRLVHKTETVIAAARGAWLLAKAGYLNARRATVHWQVLSEFAEAFPEVDAVAEHNVRDGRWMSRGSAASALDLMRQEIALRLGPVARLDAASMFLSDPGRHFASELPFGGAFTHPSARVRRAAEQMACQLEEPMRLPRVAKSAGMTLRSMARLFNAELNMSPGHYYLRLRLARARELSAQSEMPLGEVAPRCGFSCASALSRAFNRVHGRGLR